MNSTLKTFLTIIVTAAVVGGGVYFWQNLPVKDNAVLSSPPQKIDPTDRGAHSEMINTNSGIEYRNFTYRFSVILPKSWGGLMESKGDIPSGVKIHDSVRLAAKNDPAQHYIQIQVVKTEDKNDPFVSDYPQTLLTGNSAYTFYYSGSQDYAGAGGLEASEDSIKIQAEISSIQKSFKLF